MIHIRWAMVAGVTVPVIALFELGGVPTAALFAALLVAIAYALLAGGQRPLALPASGATIGQALIGVALGFEMQPSTLRAVAGDWLGVAIVTIATLAISVAVGLLIASRGHVSRATGALGLVAGGASGVVAMADELGADGRLVAFMQYLRVLVVVLVAPLVAYAVLQGDATTRTAGAGDDLGLAGDLSLTAVCALAGVLVARRLRITAGSLLCPLVIAAAVASSGLLGVPAVPSALQNAAFALIGWQVGLRFTVATIREAQALLPWVLAAIAILVVACAGLAVLLMPLADVGYADAYLATSPGGLYAVLAASVGIGANTTFVVSVQVVRVFAMILVAPPLVRMLARSEERREAPPLPVDSAVAEALEEA